MGLRRAAKMRIGVAWTLALLAAAALMLALRLSAYGWLTSTGKALTPFAQGAFILATVAASGLTAYEIAGSAPE